MVGRQGRAAEWGSGQAVEQGHIPQPLSPVAYVPQQASVFSCMGLQETFLIPTTSLELLPVCHTLILHSPNVTLQGGPRDQVEKPVH